MALNLTGSYHNTNFLGANQLTTATARLSVNVDWYAGASATFSHQTTGVFGYLLSGTEHLDQGYTFTSNCPQSSTSPGDGEGDNPGDPGSDPGSDPGAGDGSGGSCVTVTDGETGADLGTCCGTTTEEIVSCAGGMI